MRIIESFNSWKRSDRLLNENVQAAKQYMLKRFAQAKGIEASEITPEEQARIFANEDYKKVLQLIQPLPGYASTFVKFKFDHRVSFEQLAELLEKIKANSQFLGDLSMPIIEFPNQDKVNEQLNSIQDAAINNQNIFEKLMEATKVCSLGQITSALFEVGGQYRRNM